jgi:HTH-type transcriptional regulator / antitoxin HigA
MMPTIAALSPRSTSFGARPTAPQRETSSTFSLVEAYEERRWPFKSRRRFDPVDVLQYAIDELGHTQAELAKILGSRSRASEILARRRPLTLDMIQKINARWRIPADLLVQRYRVGIRAV